MAGGNKKIHEHPNAGINDFSKRPHEAGRKKMPNISEALEKILNEDEDGMIALEKVLKALRQKAFKGDVRAIQELLDRAYGKSKQNINVGSEDGSMSPQININVSDSKTKKEIDKLK